MITWGACVADYQRASRWLLPGLDRNTAPADEVILLQDRSIARAYNRILDRTAHSPVVLLHDDTELLDGARPAILAAFAEGSDLVGAIGSAGATTLAWWKAPTRRGTVGETRGTITFGPPGSVDTVDGLLIGMSPTAAAALRFDEDYDGFHGYDADVCAQARHQGMTVDVRTIPLFHHTKGGYGDRAAWDRADQRWRRKWGHRG